MYKIILYNCFTHTFPNKKKNDLDAQIIFIYISEINKYHIPLNSRIVLPLISNATELTS